MEIRAIQESDIDAIITLTTRCQYIDPERAGIYWLFWKFFRNSSFMAVEEGKVAGTLLGFISQAEPVCGYVHILAVDPDYQGRGIGKVLLDTFQNYALERDIAGIYLTTLPENKEAQAFYEHIGFTDIREFYKAGKKRIEAWRRR